MTMAKTITESPVFGHLQLFTFLVIAAIVALPPMLVHLLLHPSTYVISSSPLHVRVTAARRKFFYYAWSVMSPWMDPGDAAYKAPLLAKAYGAVLEIGAGVGDNIKYYERKMVSRLIVVEPNTNMHPQLREKANVAGFHEADGSLLLLGCGGAASDEKALALAGVGPASVDTIASIHVLCGIPGPDLAIEMYRRLLKPSGLFVFYEHVRSQDKATASWQSWYTNVVWKMAFDGCELDRPTGDWISHGHAMKAPTVKDAAIDDTRWSECHISAPKGQLPYTCVPHVMGFAKLSPSCRQAPTLDCLDTA